MSSTYAHGVEYTPATLNPSKNLDVEQLEREGITFIELTWVDFTSAVRYRVIPLSYFKKMLESSRPGIAMPKATLGLVHLKMAEGASAIGEFLYTIDLATLRSCSYKPGFASVLGWFQEKTPVVGADGRETIDAELCTRGLLRRVVDKAKAEAGVEFLCGFETEFILIRSTKKPADGVSQHAWSHSQGLLAGATETIILQEIVESLMKGGIEVTMYHAEAAPGQYEVVTGPLLPLQAADALMYTRETIVNVAAKHGMHATFAPRVFRQGPGSGAHVHVSVHSTKGEQKVPEGLSSFESSFAAGVLEHLPATLAVTLPTPASYKRVGDGAWSGGTYVCWGTDNREAPVRLANATSPSSRNFELRFLDGTSNPHLALALLLASGADGVARQTPLTSKDCSGTKVAAQMTPEERAEHGIKETDRLPATWDAARRIFAQDEFVTSVMGQAFVKQYLSVNKTLRDTLEVEGDDEMAKLTRLVEFF